MPAQTFTYTARRGAYLGAALPFLAILALESPLTALLILVLARAPLLRLLLLGAYAALVLFLVLGVLLSALWTKHRLAPAHLELHYGPDRIQVPRAAAHRLFLQQGYLATSIDAILAEAGMASKETLYRHYASKEALFVDVLRSLTMEQPGFSQSLAALPAPHNLSALRQALTQLSREILSMMSQPDYLPLVRMILAETPAHSPPARYSCPGLQLFARLSSRQGITSAIQVRDRPKPPACLGARSAPLAVTRP